MEPSKSMLEAYSLGSKYRDDGWSDSNSFWYEAVVNGWQFRGVDLPVLGDVVGAFFRAGLRGERMPIWTRAVRIGHIPRDGKSFNFRDQRWERGLSVLSAEMSEYSSDGSYEMFNPPTKDRPMVAVEGWLITDRGADGEPLLVGAVEVGVLKKKRSARRK